MSRALSRRLHRLEHCAGRAAAGGVVFLDGPWPDTPEQWDEIQAAHPQGEVFLPMPLSLEQWEADGFKEEESQ